MRQVCVGVFGLGFFREKAYDLVQKVSGTAAVGGGYAPEFTQSKRVELICVEDFLSVVNLVYAKYDGLFAAAQKVCNFCVVVCDARGGLYHKEHKICFFDGNNYLFTDFLLECVIAAG